MFEILIHKPKLSHLTLFRISPLSLVFVSACMGNGNNNSTLNNATADNSSSTGVNNAVTDFFVEGSVIKGPLFNALVGLDYDGDGNIDTAQVRTDENGNYSLPSSSSAYTVIAVTDGTTVDSSSGTVLSGVTLKAPQGAALVTPATTLMIEGNLTANQISDVLALPDGVDPVSFNPFEINETDATQFANALAVEKTSQQLLNVITAFASAAEGVGAGQTDAFSAVLTSLVNVVKTKASNYTDENASTTSKTLDLTNAEDLSLIQAQAIDEVRNISGITNAAVTTFETLANDTITAMINVNKKIANVSDLNSIETQSTFATTILLSDQIKTAAQAKLNKTDSATIEFVESVSVDLAIENILPTNLTISNTQISEAARSLDIGQISADDSDQPVDISLTYELLEHGTDYSYFALDPVTGLLSFLNQPDFEVKADYTIYISVTDQGGKQILKNFMITVLDADQLDSVKFREDSALNFAWEFPNLGSALSATLIDGTALPSWLKFDANTATFSGTPLNLNVGTQSITVTALDDTENQFSDTFDLTILNTNDLPFLGEEISDRAVAQNETISIDLSSTFNDVDIGDSLTLSATLNDGTALPEWLMFDANTKKLEGTPLNQHVGSQTIKLTATDNSGAEISETFILTVTDINDDPTVVTLIEDQEVDEDSDFSLTLSSNTFVDVDVGDSLILSSTLNDGTLLPSWITFFPSTATFSGTPLNQHVGTQIIKVTATDDSGAKVSDTFDLTIVNTNDSPSVISLIPDQSIAHNNTLSIDLSDYFTDVDIGDNLSLSATLNDGTALPSWLSFDLNTNVITINSFDNIVEELDILVSATDVQGANVSDTFTVSKYTLNSYPFVQEEISDRAVAQDETISIDLSSTFNDVDIGDSLTLSATLNDGTALPEWLMFDANTKKLEGTPLNQHVGSQTIKLTATDNSGAEISETFILTVTDINDDPTVVTLIEDQEVDEDSDFSLTLSSNTFVDVDVGDSLILSSTLNDGTLLPSWITFFPSTATFSGTPLNQHVGTQIIKVTATDDSGAKVSDTFDLTIVNTNDSPSVISLIPDQSIAHNNTLSIDLSDYFTDVDIGDNLSLSATLNDGTALPSWLSFDLNTNVIIATPSANDFGEFDVLVTTTDLSGETAEDLVSFIII